MQLLKENKRAPPHLLWNWQKLIWIVADVFLSILAPHQMYKQMKLRMQGHDKEALCLRLWILQPSWAQNILQHKCDFLQLSNHFKLWNDHWTILRLNHTDKLLGENIFLGGQHKNQSPWQQQWENTPNSSTKTSPLIQQLGSQHDNVGNLSPAHSEVVCTLAFHPGGGGDGANLGQK